jgi:formylglycine-generating enzyme required for sulfatase activity
MESILKRCLPTYEVVRKIGSGVYGSVYLVKDNLKERAVKIVPIMVERSLSNRSKKDLDSKISHDFYAIQEYYQRIKGESVVEIHDFHLVDKQVSKQEAKAYLVILMEYCPQNLLDRILDHYPIPQGEAIGLMEELARILHNLSGRSEDAFIVKDLKPSNLLINQNGKLVVGDLGGIERISSISVSTAAQFTPNWSAPELVTHSAPGGITSLVFSYGFVSYFVWCGSLPYERADFSERLHLIKEKGITFSRSDIPVRIRSLISQCLNIETENRPKDFATIIELLTGDGATPGKNLFRRKTDRKPGKRAPDAKHDKPSDVISQEAPRPSAPWSHHAGDTWEDPAIGMKFTWIPCGSFQMGCGSWDGEGKKNELPVHEVSIDGFWLGIYPVTQDQWKQVMANSFWQKVRGNNPSWFKMGGNFPVEQISLNDARDFILKITSINNNRYHFRLPTETEWEYAARSGGRPEKYPGGKAPEEIAWFSTNSGMTTQPVGTLAPNGLGLYDMSGNVYEWCADFYHEDAYGHHAGANPINSREAPRRVIRGGSWCSFLSELRCTYRGSVNQDFRGNFLGMRLVMTPISRRSHQ